MLSAPFRVVLDACVLPPMNLRDVLLPNDVLSLIDATLCSKFVALVGEHVAGVDTER